MAISVRTDSHGRKRFSVYVWDKINNRKLYVATFGSRKDAEHAERQAKVRLGMGEPITPPRIREEITFDRLAERWISGLSNVRPSTREDYRKAIRRLKPLIGTMLVSNITRRDIDAAISVLAGHYAASTTRKTLTVAKMVFRVAIDWNYVDRMPTGGTRLPLPKVRKRTFRPLTQDEVLRLLDSAPKEWRVFYLLLLTSGMRRGEALGIRVCDLDLQNGSVQVSHQLVRGRLEDLKTDASRRRIPLPSCTVQALKDHLTTRPENDLDLVFVGPGGGPVDADNLFTRVHVPTREKAGLPKLRLHDLRHQYCSTLLASGCTVKFVQTVAGHVDASTTLDTYGWLMPGEEEKAVTELEDWLGLEDAALYCAA